MHKYIRLNMSTGKARILPLAPEMALEGGRGFAARVLCSDMNPAAPALGPENVLVFGAGLLAGLEAPCFGHLTVGAKGPLTQTFTAEALPGIAGRLLARLGFRAVVVTGQPQLATAHVLVISEPLVALREAPTSNPDDLLVALRHEFGDSVAILSPTPRTENARTAIRIAHPAGCRPATCGAPGLGAVMLAKGLAAIVFCADGARKNAAHGRLRDGLGQFRKLLVTGQTACAHQSSPPLATPETVTLDCLGLCPEAQAVPNPPLFEALGDMLTGLYGGTWPESRVLDLGRETLAREKAFDSWAGPSR